MALCKVGEHLGLVVGEHLKTLLAGADRRPHTKRAVAAQIRMPGDVDGPRSGAIRSRVEHGCNARVNETALGRGDASVRSLPDQVVGKVVALTRRSYDGATLESPERRDNVADRQLRRFG